jgi:protein angel
VAIIVKLALKSDPESKLVVATTHLLYNPRRQDVRLAQIQVLLAELDRIAYDDVPPQPNDKTAKDYYVPIILTGDFNLQPYTAPYRLLTQGFLQYDSLTERTLEMCHDRSQLSGRELLPLGLGITDHCQHIHVLNNVRNQTKVNIYIFYL